MNSLDFHAFLAERLDNCRTTMEKKNPEYARGDDKFNNFKRAAAVLRCTPERALIGFLIKHTISILDMVDDLERGVYHPYPMWQEKVGDQICYSILLEGMAKERLKTKGGLLHEANRSNEEGQGTGSEGGGPEKEGAHVLRGSES